MYLGDLIKCPDCQSVIDEENVFIERSHIRTKKSYTDEGIVGCEDGVCPVIDVDSIPICEKMDTVFAKCFCPTCQTKFKAMIPIEATPLTSFSASGNDKLVMITH